VGKRAAGKRRQPKETQVNPFLAPMGRGVIDSRSPATQTNLFSEEKGLGVTGTKPGGYLFFTEHCNSFKQL